MSAKKNEIVDHGPLFLVTAPSGAGKTSLVRAWCEQDPTLSVAISHTTRAPRGDETCGVHYHFVDDDTFQENVGAGRFLEHAQVFQHRYGTSIEAVERLWDQDQEVVLEIDWQGAEQIKASFKAAVWILIVPPDVATLEDRLRARNQDSEEVIQSRMAEAVSEMTCYQASDYIVVNEDFTQALEALQCIASAERMRSSRPQHQKRMEKLLRFR